MESTSWFCDRGSNTSTSTSGTWSCGQSPKWRTPFTDSKLGVAIHEALCFDLQMQEVLNLVVNSTSFFFPVITLLPLFNLEALQLQLPIFETRKLIHFFSQSARSRPQTFGAFGRVF